MAKLPGMQDLGPTPAAPETRPVGSYDVSAFARGGAAIAQGAERLGAGIEKAGQGIGELATDISHWDYGVAHSQFLTQKIDLDAATAQDTNYGPDADGKTLPQRYQEKLNGIRDAAAAQISTGPMRQYFLNRIAPVVEEANVRAQAHARGLENDASIAYVSQVGDKMMDQAVTAGDDATRTQLIDSHNQLIDGLQAKGAITAVQAVQMKQEWARRYATADVLARADSDPQGVINELRAAPGSNAAITNRILQVEGGGKNAASSATGAGQFIDSTWLDVLKRNRPDLAAGKSDDELLALRADKNLARDMTEAYRGENEAYLKRNGIAPTPGNQYLAHFLGPAGAKAVLTGDPNKPVGDVLAAALGKDKAAAMVAANPSVLGGQLASSVRQWADAKMGGAQPGGGSLYDILRPDVRETVLSRAEANLQKQQTSDLVGFRSTIQDHLTEVANTGLESKPLTQGDFIAHYGAERGPDAYKDYRAEVQNHVDTRAMATMDPEGRMALLESRAPQPGEPGYAAASQRYGRLSKTEQGIEAAEAIGAKANLAADALVDLRTYPSLDPEQRLAVSAKHANTPAAQAFYDLEKHLEGVQAGYEEAAQTRALPGMSPAERRDVLAAQTEAPRQQRLAAAWKNLDKELAADPAGYTLKYLPGVKESFDKITAAQNDADRTKAYQDFAATTIAAQTRLGLSPEEMKVAPQWAIDNITSKFQQAVTSDDAQARTSLIGVVQKEAANWSQYWPQVMRQLAPSIAPQARAIAAGADPNAMVRLLSLDPKENPKELLKEQDEAKAARLTTALNEAFRPFLSSVVGRQRDRDYFPYYQMGEKLAALYARDGKSESDAATAAFNDLIGKNWDFRDTYRIPKSTGFPADDIQAGAQAARSLIAPQGNLLEQARAQYPILKNQDYGYVENFRPGAGFLEHWEPGEPGAAPTAEQPLEALRPTGLPLNKPGLEIRDRNTRPIDILGDIVSHNLVNTDATVKAAYEKLQGSLTPKQQDLLRDQYQHAKDNEGETRSFEDWKTAAGMPAFFRGYTFQQWPKEFTDKTYTPEQRADLDKLMVYLSRSGTRTIAVRPPLDDMPGRTDAAADDLRLVARDGKWITAPDGSGLNLAYGDKFVRDASNKPLLLPWAQLAALGKGRAPVPGEVNATGGIVP